MNCKHHDLLHYIEKEQLTLKQKVRNMLTIGLALFVTGINLTAPAVLPFMKLGIALTLSFITLKITFKEGKKFAYLLVSFHALIIVAAYLIPLESILQSPRSLADYGIYLLMIGLQAKNAIEAWGYILHRFVQHLGLFTVNNSFLKYSQSVHRAHHRKFYAFGRNYSRKRKSEKVKYRSKETQLSVSWLLPSIIAVYIPHICLTIMAKYAQPESLLSYFSAGTYTMHFLISFYVLTIIYALIAIDYGHQELHFDEQWWDDYRSLSWFSGYFWVCRILHEGHHFHEKYGFGILFYEWDAIAGTLLQDLRKTDIYFGIF